MNDPLNFELEPEPPKAPAKTPSELAGKPTGPVAPNMPSVRRTVAASVPESGFLSHIDPRVRKRLKRVVPTLAVLFVIVGLFFVGTGIWAFALAGAATGVFAAFKRPGEGALGAFAGAAGYGAAAAAIRQVPMGIGAIFVVGICGCFGALVAIDDRLGGP